jgi:hypothetical protein
VVEETRKIKQHIADERENLGRNLDEIEYRLKDATNLKGHFDRNIGLILGAAVAGGFLLSLALGKSAPAAGDSNWKTHSGEGPTTNAGTRRSHFASTHLNQVSETVDNIVGGLVGVFSEKLRSFVADAVPGFREQYDAVTQHDRYSGPEVRSRVQR